jgi:hypothetical protein
MQTEEPILTGDYFDTKNDISITYNPELKLADVATVIPGFIITELEEPVPTEADLYKLYTNLAIQHKTVPIIITVRN